MNVSDMSVWRGGTPPRTGNNGEAADRPARRAFRAEEDGAEISLGGLTGSLRGDGRTVPEGGFSEDTVYGETPLPFSKDERERAPSPPERIRQMRRLYVYGRESAEARAENFCRQGKFMEDFEDDAPWSGSFTVFYPTYQDLTISQLRGYFSWRSRARRGEFFPIAASAAYLYIYELLNGIGTASPAESLARLRAFEEGFLDAGYGDSRMRVNVRRWMLELAVVSNLPVSLALEYADPEMLQTDTALGALLSSEDDAEVFAALCRLGGKKYEKSPAFAEASGRGRRLMADIWRRAEAECRPEGKAFFEAVFGKKVRFRWQPFANAVYCAETSREVGRLSERPGGPGHGAGEDAEKAFSEDREYELNKCRRYLCQGGSWQMEAYDKVFFHLHWLRELLHAADARLRRYLGTGKYLTEKPEEAWARPWIDAAIREDERERAETARPKIRINLSGLDRIRSDALETQNSLLVEEAPASEAFRAIGREDTEGGEAFTAREANGRTEEAGCFGRPEGGEAFAVSEGDDSARDSGEGLAAGLLAPEQIQILRTLLRGEPVESILRGQHLMASLVADEINERLYDTFGDNVLECEDDRLSIFEDYKEELREFLE